MMDLCYEYWYASYYHLIDLKKRELFNRYGSAKAIYEATEASLGACGVLSKPQIHALMESRDKSRIAKETEGMIAKGIQLVTLGMKEYPIRLREVADAPYGLFYYGDLSIANQRAVGMVGARRATGYGRAMAEHYARYLAEREVTIISGMARGIDGASHRGALQANGKTIAVLGGGVEYCYPKENRDIYERIKAEGLVISQYCPGTQPVAYFFPARNRIISGLSDVVMVMEAREKSGSLITVDFALEQGRDIYALPGRITDAMSGGCNRLIYQGAGMLITPDILWRDLSQLTAPRTMETERLQVQNTHYQPTKLPIIDKTKEQVREESDNSPEFSLEKEESLVYSCFDFYARSIQDVADETGLDLLKLISIVMRLCELGLIRESFKNQYIRCK